LADYSSRGFLTPKKNVNEADNDMLLPYRSANQYAQEYVPAGSDTCSPQQGGVNYLRGTVPDSITGVADPVKMASDSLLNGKYGLNRCVFDDRAVLLIPRAVGYSAGLIDYFFRGTLEINRPTEGVFAVVDHSKPENQCTFNASGAPGCGFKKIKMKLKNTTADIVVSGGGGTFKQHMSGGKLYAIAKYHNNTCFDPSFQSPIYGAGPAAAVQCRSVDEVITLSDAYSATPFTLNAGEEKELEFTFNTNAIPFSATDLYLQVVYRGKLGTEDDAVVVGTYDVSEPTFITLANYTDVKIDVPNKTCTVAPTTGTVKPFDFDAKLYVLQGKLNDPGPPQYRELMVTRLDPGQYSRFVFLGDALEANMFARAYYTVARDVWFNMDNGIPNIVSQLITPTFFQRKDDGLIYYPNEEYKVREGYGHLWGVYNSRFYGRVTLGSGVSVSYDDVVKVIKDCPGTVALKPIDTLAF
jgi:hypothetical protein